MHVQAKRSTAARLLALFVLIAVPAACSPADTDTDAEAGAAAAGDTTVAEEAAGPLTIADVGLQTPESALYDEQADVYLVSNINGEPLGRDNNGFISRIRPDGTMEQLRWIAGGANGVSLNAPKGLAIIGDTLFVADIDTVRAFNRTSGAPVGARGVPNASFLNDLAVGAGGALYVTDTGVDASFAPNGADAIYRFEGASAVPVAQGAQLAQPNGIAVSGDAIVVVSFGAATVSRVAPGGAQGGGVTPIATLPAGQLDGVVRLPDGTLLVSSWEAQTVFRIDPAGQVAAVVQGVESPADIGWDSRRSRVLIPIFMGTGWRCARCGDVPERVGYRRPRRLPA